MWAKRRRRKSSSPDPEGGGQERAISVDERPSSPSKSRSIFRRPSPTHDHLPTFSSPASTTCNNFLLGGHYYPGKDKTRRQLRRRRIWYRLFCSTPGRMTCSIIVLSYIVLWHVLVPLTDKILEYGKTLSGGGGARRWRSPPPPPGVGKSTEALRKIPGLENIRSFEQTKLFHKLLEEEREKLLYGPENRMKERLKLYKKMVPDWYHHYIENDGKPMSEEGTDVFDEDPTVPEDDEEDIEAKPQEKKEIPEKHHADKPKEHHAVHRKDKVEQDKKQKHVKKIPAIGTEPKAKKEAAAAAKLEKEDVIGKEEEHHDPPPSLESIAEEDTNADVRAAHRNLPVSGNHTKKKVSGEKEADPHHLPPIALNTSKNEAKTEVTPGKEENHHDPPKIIDSATEDIHIIKVPANKNNTKLHYSTSRRVARTLQNMDNAPSYSNCPAGLHPTDISTTLVIQSSLDRMWILKETCSRWKDPIVAVVYMYDDEARDEVWKEPADWTTVCPQLTVIPYGKAEKDEIQGYPVNTLRNIGLDAANTSHILVMDVDFVPSMDLQKTIRATLKERLMQTEQHQSDLVRDAIIVPAFERIPPKPCKTANECGAYLKANSSFIPHTLDSLRSCVSQKECFVFQQNINWEGHFSTHSDSWLMGDWYDDPDEKNVSETGRRIKNVKCFDTLRYEPYVLLRWCPASSSQTPLTPVAPYYDERFYGYGKNKIQLISHLRFMGYSFAILPRGFIVHNPHPESDVKKVWNNVTEFDLHEKMDKLYPEFLHELWNKYRNTTKYIVEPCKHTHKKKKHP